MTHISKTSWLRLCLQSFHGGPCVRLHGHAGLCTKNVRLAPLLDQDDGLIAKDDAHPAISFPNDGVFAVFLPGVIR